MRCSNDSAGAHRHACLGLLAAAVVIAVEPHGRRGMAGLFSSRFSPRFLSLRPLPPSRGGEGWDGGEKHGLGTPPACTPTLALPLAQGGGKDRQARVRKLNGPALGLLGPLGYARHHTEHSLP